jgi:hypothetical protein
VIREHRALYQSYNVILLVPLVVWLVFTIAGHPGWGVAASILVLLAIGYVSGERDKARKRREELRLQNEAQRARIAPCPHGVAGARQDPTRCAQCVETRETAEREKAERLRLQRQAAFETWKAKNRVPEYLRQMDPFAFEHLVCELYRSLGYEVIGTPPAGDGGVDAFARRSGQTFLLQCKRVKKGVGEPVLRDLFGTVTALGASGGILVTTGTVSEQAKRWSAGKPLEIVDFDTLVARVQAAFSEGSIVPDTFDVPDHKIDLCPHCGSRLRVVRWRRKRFLGCSAFPGCKFTRSLGRGR